jgi:hypothetical protein
MIVIENTNPKDPLPPLNKMKKKNKVHLLEVKFTSDHRILHPTTTGTANRIKYQPYIDLIRRRLQLTHTGPNDIQYHTVVLGALGCVFPEHKDILKRLGVQSKNITKTLHKLHRHSIRSLDSIVATRHTLAIKLKTHPG